MSSHKTILVAEDDPDIRRLLCHALGREFQVIAAEDGAQALALAGDRRLHLLITDVMMPTLDGYHLAHQIRLLPGMERLPIIFLTARDTPTDQVTAIGLGAKHFLTKPFSLTDITEKVRRALAA